MKTLIGIIVALALIGGAGGWYWYHNSGPVFAFRTAEVVRGEMVPTISATGTVEPQEVVDVGAQIEGQIMSFGKDSLGKLVDYGSPVNEGTVLANIDATLYIADQENAKATLAQAKAGVKVAQANLQQMQAKLDQATSDWNRAQTLKATEALSQTDYENYKAVYETGVANVAVAEAAIDQASATVLQDQAQLNKANKNVEYCTITSPVKGVIVDRRVSIGETVVSSLNTPSLFLLAKDLTQIQVWVSVNEADIGQVYAGQPVTFGVDAFPSRTFKGTVGKVRLNATMTQNVVTYTVEVNTSNEDGTLFPYMTANVQFEVSRKPDVLLVPNAALRWYPPRQEMVAPDVREAAAKKQKASDNADSTPAADEPHHHASTTKPSTRPAIVERHGHGTLWVVDGKFVRPIKVRTGATDGVNTEVSARDEEIKTGMQLVVGEQQTQSADSGTTNPFAPQPIWGKKKH